MHKVIIILSVCFLFNFKLNAQSVIQKKTSNTREICFVLKSDTSVKHGPYKYLREKGKWIEGYYKNGKRDSIWTFFGTKGEVIQKYDFTHRKLIYYNSTIPNTKCKVLNNTSGDSLTRKPFIAGSYSSNPFDIIEYPKEATKNKISGDVIFSFVLDRYGNIYSLKMLEGLGYGLDEIALKLIKKEFIRWIPGEIKGETVDVEIEQKVHFYLGNEEIDYDK